MPRGLKLTEFEKGQITAYEGQNKSNRWIANKLNRSLDVINRYVKDKANYGTTKRSGRPQKLSVRQKRHIVRKASNSTISCATIKRELGLEVHRDTVRNVLKANPNIVRRKKHRAPAITDNDKVIRLAYARRNMITNWDCVSFFLIFFKVINFF